MGDINNPNESNLNGQQGYQNINQTQNQQPGNQQGGYQQPGYQQPGNQQGGYQQSGYQQPGNQQGGYQQSGYQQPGNQQGGYQQSGYQQPGYQQPIPQYQQPQYSGQSPSQQPEYQYQGYQQYRQPENYSGLAIGSMVCGIVSLCICCCFWFVSLPLSIIGLVLGIIAIKNGGNGKGMAIAGIATSGATIALAILTIAGCSSFYTELLNEIKNSSSYY